MVLLVADWIYPVRAVFYFLLAAKMMFCSIIGCVSAIVFLRFSFHGLMHMLVQPLPLVFCAVSIRRQLLKFPRQLYLISGMLQEPS